MSLFHTTLPWVSIYPGPNRPQSEWFECPAMVQTDCSQVLSLHVRLCCFVTILDYLYILIHLMSDLLQLHGEFRSSGVFQYQEMLFYVTCWWFIRKVNSRFCWPNWQSGLKAILGLNTTHGVISCRLSEVFQRKGKKKKYSRRDDQ